MRSQRPFWRVTRALLVLAALVTEARATPFQGSAAPAESIANGDMEALDPAGKPGCWRFSQTLLEAGYELGSENEDVHGGAHAARIDSFGVESVGSSFGNLMQGLDATPLRGKRVRLRAAIKVAEAEAGGHAQMWMRVDVPAAGGQTTVGFFDNMQDRPIAQGEWATYEIVGDVARDAKGIVLGVMTLGHCLVLVDDVTFEAVDSGVAKTGEEPLDAPRQPFLSPWLWLPLATLVLFGLGYLARGPAGTFAFRFTLAYWVQYAGPTLLASLVPFLGQRWSTALEAGPLDALVRWAARALFGIHGELVSAIGNGSGDTTYSYVQAFLTFALALVVALVWSLVDRHAREHAALKDLLRSGLRYYLAIMMAGYGLAKLATLGNQLPAPGTWRLAQPFGNASPMGLLWTFMGSSRAYTHFAGAMELLSALLLVWRRTALLGALASACVMFNVLMMNLCYDTPVKLFSAHLVAAATCIALPDAGRLARLFLGLGAGDGAPLGHPFSGKVAGWTHRGLKAVLLLLVLGLPLYAHWSTERSTAAARPALGEWKLATLELDGQPVAPASGEVEFLTLVRPTASADGWSVSCTASLVGGASASAVVTLTPERLRLAGDSGGKSRILSGEFNWSVLDEELCIEAPGVRATFRPAVNEYLLMRRGFRWINEHPFNR